MSHPAVANAIHLNINESLAKQVEGIALEISEKWNECKEIGLMEGRSGMVILFAYLSKLFPEKGYEASTLYYLNELKESLARDELGYGLSNGVAGIGFVFQHLKNLDVLNSWLDLDLSELDEFIDMGVENDFKNGNWDPVLGLTGLGIYFLERNKESGEKKFLENIVDHLANMRTNVGGHHVWITSGYKNYVNDTYNFGTAHGMPGVLSFLAQVHARGIRQNEIKEMIDSCLSFLLEYEYYEDSIYCFPQALDTDNPSDTGKPYSRLGWCYGDLCMANALIHCGKALQREGWYDKGIAIALKTTHRNFEDSGCVDAPFCHGTVGLVHQYHRLYELTQHKEFKYARDNWMMITQEHFYKPREGAGGYYFQSYNSNTDAFEPKAQWGLLEGSCGIALVYLSVLYGIKPDWDIIFLTNV